MTIKAEAFEADDKKAFLYRGERADSPLVLLNEYMGDGSSVAEKLHELCAGDKERPDLNILVVSGLDWDSDMSPWYCEPVFPGEEPYGGKADEYLELLLGEIIPKAKTLLGSEPSSMVIAGYSLAGLFALYAMYRCDAFDSVASMSGSLWFPGFVDFVREHEMKVRPDKVYLSLGSKEAKTRHPYMKEVQNCTEEIVEIYKSKGLDVTWELNPGNHFKNVEERCAKGIKSCFLSHKK